jgi:NAD(P)-dependent dehydrogenase (short-subunit alcohol dehydrogenase family)
MNRLLESKVALVTGGTLGIGRGVALGLARSGAKVAICGRHDAAGNEAIKLIEAAGGAASFTRADVSKSAQVDGLIARVVERFGRLDIAFNNAGLAATFRPFYETTEEDYAGPIDTASARWAGETSSRPLQNVSQELVRIDRPALAICIGFAREDAPLGGPRTVDVPRLPDHISASSGTELRSDASRTRRTFAASCRWSRGYPRRPPVAFRNSRVLQVTNAPSACSWRSPTRSLS